MEIETTAEETETETETEVRRGREEQVAPRHVGLCKKWKTSRKWYISLRKEISILDINM